MSEATLTEIEDPNVEKYLGISVAAIGAGALVYAAATAWVEFIRALTDDVYDPHPTKKKHGQQRYEASLAAVTVAVLMTFIAALVLIIIFGFLARTHIFH